MISDAAGTPLLIHTTPANVRDDMPAVAMVRQLLENVPMSDEDVRELRKLVAQLRDSK